MHETLVADRLESPHINTELLKTTDVVVVHGGSGEHGVVAGMFFLGVISKLSGRDVPVLFSGKWSYHTDEQNRPRNSRGEAVSEAEYMKEYALSYGLSEDRIFTEAHSYNTDENVQHSLRVLAEQGIEPRTILFISAHSSPRRARISWERHGKGIKFIGIGNMGHKLALKNQGLLQQVQYYATELAKTAVTHVKSRAR